MYTRVPPRPLPVSSTQCNAARAVSSIATAPFFPRPPHPQNSCETAKCLSVTRSSCTNSFRSRRSSMVGAALLPSPPPAVARWRQSEPAAPTSASTTSAAEPPYAGSGAPAILVASRTHARNVGDCHHLLCVGGEQASGAPHTTPGPTTCEAGPPTESAAGRGLPRPAHAWKRCRAFDPGTTSGIRQSRRRPSHL